MSQQQPPHGWGPQQPPHHGYGPPPQGYGPPPGHGPPGWGPPPQKVPWYHEPPGLIVTLIFCFPVGLAFLWGSPKVSRPVQIGVTAFFALLVLIAVVSPDSKKGGQASTSTDTAATPEPVQGTTARTPTTRSAPTKQEPTFISETCLELSKKFGAGSNLSDLQKEEMWPDYKGKAFKWKLEVVEVSSDTFGGYTVQFKCAPQSPSLIQDIQLKYEDDAKPVVLQLTKGSVYEVKGTLKNSSTLLGLTGDALP